MRTTMRYEGRAEAGSVLAEELRGLGLGPCVVAGIPRGGLMVAARVAEHLGAPLVAVHASKLYLPREPELAFGALAEDGHAVLDYRATVTLGLGESDVEEIKAAVAREMASRIASYPGPRLADYVPRDAVVIVDDGLATGLTMQAAIGYARRLGATAIVAAVPCASDRAAYEVGSLLSRSDDRLVCLVADPDFRAVSDYYRDFRPASDQQVAQLLAQHAPALLLPGGSPAPPHRRHGPRLVLLELVLDLARADAQDLGGPQGAPGDRLQGSLDRLALDLGESAARDAQPGHRTLRGLGGVRGQGGEMHGGEHGLGGEHDRALDRVLELAHVSRPGMAQEQAQGLVRETADLLRVCGGEPGAGSGGPAAVMSVCRSRSGGMWSSMTFSR